VTLTLFHQFVLMPCLLIGSKSFVCSAAKVNTVKCYRDYNDDDDDDDNSDKLFLKRYVSTFKFFKLKLKILY